MFVTIGRWWAGHGTKILGTFVSVVGILEELLPLIQHEDPKHSGTWALVAALGVAIVKRGFTNTKQAQP